MKSVIYFQFTNLFEKMLTFKFLNLQFKFNVCIFHVKQIILINYGKILQDQKGDEIF